MIYGYRLLSSSFDFCAIKKRPFGRIYKRLLHTGEAFHGFGEALDGLFRVAVFDAVADAMLDASFQNGLSAAVQCGFRRVDLEQRVLDLVRSRDGEYSPG